MKNIYIRIVTGIGLVTILALQIVWLYNTYHLIRENIAENCNKLFDAAINMEVIDRLSSNETLKGVTFEGPSMAVSNEVLPGSVYLQESLLQYNLDIQLESLDSIYTESLANQEIPCQVYIDRLYSANDSVMQTTRTGTLPAWGMIKTKPFPIRLDGSQYVQAVIVNPYKTIFERMGLLLIATAIMMVLVFGCIIYQIKIINRQNKIAKMREDFSYAMIHDMKTPLSAILMGSHILQSGKLDDKPEKKQRHFQILREEAEHLLTLTNKILTLSKLENHQLALSIEPVAIAAIVDDLSEKFTVQAQKPITFANHIQQEIILADVEFIREAISNLIDNAIKYSGESVHIDISCEKTERSFNVIKVKDNGLGISPEDQKKIFEKYERAAAFGRSRKGGASGFGLGLNYVQRIAEAHGGHVLVESVEGEYSEFMLYLPCRV